MSFVLAVVGACLILEGALPLLAPKLWRKRMTEMLALSPGQLRSVGLLSVLGGLLLLWVS